MNFVLSNLCFTVEESAGHIESGGFLRVQILSGTLEEFIEQVGVK